MAALCRDCSTPIQPRDVTGRCPACGSPRILSHPELDTLAIAHVDCDAFYASVEKRDNPALVDRPVIIGSRRRGVVMTCCYVARMYGIGSAMPMFKALKRCPEAVVLSPDMKKYQAASRQVRVLMLDVTPLVEPVSIDEAFLDLTGTERLHKGSPARTLIRLAQAIERELDLTVSIGLSYNKFLAKIASALDKPRGFAVIGRAEALEFLRPKPVSLIWGVGAALQRRLIRDGITTIGQLKNLEEVELVARYGTIGRRLARFSRGEDDRRVTPDAPAKSISAETTLEQDIAALDGLKRALWPLCERVAKRLKHGAVAGRVVTLKLKTTDFKLRTRSQRLATPTQLAEVLYRSALWLLEREADGTAFRLLGVGAGALTPAAQAEMPDLLDPATERRAQTERIIDEVRAKLGDAAIQKGRSLLAIGPSPAAPSGQRGRRHR